MKKYTTKAPQSSGKGILSGAIERSIRQTDYPFYQYAKKPNPFVDNQKRSELYKLITDLVQYADECADFTFWTFGEKSQIDEAIIRLESKAKKMHSQLKSLIPKESKSIRKKPIMRIFEESPENLVRIIEFLTESMKIYDNTYEHKIKGKRRADKRRDSIADKPRAIKEFYKIMSTSDLPSNANIDDRSYTTIALSLVAHTENCSFDGIKKIYYSVPLKRRREISKQVLSERSSLLTSIFKP